MPRCAVVQNSDNVCINMIVADMTDPAPIGCYLVDVDNIWCDIGWVYDPVLNEFFDPNPSPLQAGGD